VILEISLLLFFINFFKAQEKYRIQFTQLPKKPDILSISDNSRDKFVGNRKTYELVFAGREALKFSPALNSS
jgi:hypothetical protein